MRNECDCGQFELDNTGHVVCRPCRVEYLEQRRAQARQLLRAETERPAARGPVYTFAPDGSPIGKCEDRRCNAHALLKRMTLCKVMKTVVTADGEQLIQVERLLCPNCTAQLGNAGGKIYPSESTAPAALTAPTPKPSLAGFWAQRFGKQRTLSSTELLGSSVDTEFHYRIVKRQG
jgi:hypothetical protein